MSDPGGGAGLRVAERRDIAAPAAAAWAVLTDYVDGHPAILPRPWIEGLDVIEGGSGAGTVLDVRLRGWRGTRTMRLRVSEPEPGRVLQEVAPAEGTRTTFTVDALAGDAGCRVEIATEWPRRAGVAAAIERFVLRMAVPHIYRRQLALLARRTERAVGGLAGR